MDNFKYKRSIFFNTSICKQSTASVAGFCITENSFKTQSQDRWFLVTGKVISSLVTIINIIKDCINSQKEQIFNLHLIIDIFCD